jgi:acyl carrier protein
VDRKALAEVAAGTATREAAGEYVAPRTPIEEMLAQIWADVLRVDRVGINDNFFALGGHSLLAIQVLSRVKETFQVEPPLRRLFETPTIAGLAVAIPLAQAEKADGEEIARILAELEQLSDDDAQSMVASKYATGSP